MNLIIIFFVVAVAGSYFHFWEWNGVEVLGGLTLAIGLTLWNKLDDIEKQLQKVFDFRRGDAFDQDMRHIEM